MRHEPLEVAEERAGDAEGADRDDGDQQGEDDRLGAGPHDEPARGRRQSDAGCRGRAAEQPADEGPAGRGRSGRSAAGHATPSDALAGQHDVLVGQGDELGAVGHDDHGAALASGEHRARARRRRRRGGRSARRGAGPARWTARPGPARARPAVRPTARSRRHPAGSRAPAGGGDEAVEPDQAQRVPDGLVARAVAQAEGVAQVPAGRNGRWVTRWARPGARYRRGRAQPGSSSRRVDLPTPEGPVTAVRPGPAARCDVDEHRAAAPGRCRRGLRPTPTSPPPSGVGSGLGVELGQDAVDGLGAVGGGVELGADAADRPVGLGRQEDRDRPVCRVILPWVSRRPTVTATMATEIVASSSRAAEVMKAMRSGSSSRRGGAG